MNIIQVNELTRDFQSVRALDRITFHVERGEIFGFLGPNGAGKTTTIKILTGQLRPTSGRASVAGCDVVRDRAALKPRIGVVFEHQNIYENLSARDNLTFIGQLYGMKRGDVDRALELVGLLDRANEKTRHFSNGMKQRLLIARAVLHKPRVLFLDEPTRGLDPNIAREIRDFILRLSREGITIFLTTHYMEEADRLCGRVAILDEGKIAALGVPVDLKKIHGKRPGATLEDVFVHLTGRSIPR